MADRDPSQTRNLSADPYDGNDIASDFGMEIRSHEVGIKIWNFYKIVKEANQEPIDLDQSPQSLLTDILACFSSWRDFQSIGIREEDIELIMTVPHELFCSVPPKSGAGERKTTWEVSGLGIDATSNSAGVTQRLVFLRNVLAVVAGLAKNSITSEQHRAIITDRKAQVVRLIGHEIPSWKQ